MSLSCLRALIIALGQYVVVSNKYPASERIKRCRRTAMPRHVLLSSKLFVYVREGFFPLWHLFHASKRFTSLTLIYCFVSYEKGITSLHPIDACCQKSARAPSCSWTSIVRACTLEAWLRGEVWRKGLVLLTCLYSKCSMAGSFFQNPLPCL